MKGGNGMDVIVTNELSKTYGENETLFYALNKVNIKIKEEEMVAVTGPSGSGKSTLLHLLGGIDEPTEGTVILNGENLYMLKKKQRLEFLRKNVGLIYQFFNLIPVLTVRENIEFPLLLSKKHDHDFVTELIEAVGLKEKEDCFSAQLSGGQQQRVAIARALATKPKIILADEPTGNLDSKTSDEIIDILMELCKKYKRSVLIVTHDPGIAKRCDREIKLVDGKIL